MALGYSPPTMGSGVLRRLRALFARTPVARVYDAATLLWISFFHHVLVTRFRCAPFGFDEHYFVHEGWSVTKGLVPYRDLQEFKPPMIYFVNALGIGLFGLDGLAYRNMFSLLSLCAFLALAIALLSRGVSRLLVAALFAIMIDHFLDRGLHDSSINNAETLGLDFFMIGCGVLLVRTTWERSQQVVGAAVLALSPLSKEPLAIATVTAWLALLLLYRAESPRPGAGKRFALHTAAGVAGVVVVWLGYMLATRSLGWYIVMLKLTAAYTKNYSSQLGWFPKNPEGGVLGEYWRRLQAPYINWGHLGPFVPLFIAPVALWDGRRRRAGIAALATLLAAIYAITVGRGFAGHYFVMGMTGVFFAAVVGAIALDVYARASGPAMVRWVGITWVAAAWLILNPRFAEEWKKLPDYKPAAAPVSKADVDFVRAHTKPGERIWTLGDPLIYVYADRLTAFREGVVIDEVINYYPGDTDEQRLAGQREELLETRPKLIILGEDQVSYARRQRYLRALVSPLLRDLHYVKLSDKFYERP
jgi:hypothetical protein